MRNEKRAAVSCSFCCIVISNVGITKMGIIGRMGLMGRISLMGLMGRISLMGLMGRMGLMGLMEVINGRKGLNGSNKWAQRALRKPKKKTSRPFDGASLP